MVDSVVVSGRLPNIYPEMISKDNLELSIIWSAPFAAGFLEIILIFQKWDIAPFLVSFSGMITLELHSIPTGAKKSRHLL